MFSRRQLPGWLNAVTVAVAGLMIALAVWPTENSSAGRFWIDVLVGMSVVALGTGVVAYLRERRRAAKDDPSTFSEIVESSTRRGSR